MKIKTPKEIFIDKNIQLHQIHKLPLSNRLQTVTELAVTQTSVKVIDAYPENSKLFFAQRIFEHSVIQNHCITNRCELRIAV